MASSDRISSLPIQLLMTIVSLLPFKESMRASIISSKWLKACKLTKNIKEILRRDLVEFIHFWIDNYKGTVMEKFSLRFSMPGNHDSDIIDQCNENNIYYGDYDEALFELPEQQYSCSFVETEVLNNFHELKEVSLGWIEVRLSAIKALLSNYNMLESLSFKRCWNLEKFDLGEEQHTEENLNFSLEYGFEGLGHPLYNTVISTGLELLGFQSDDMLVQHLIMKTYGFAQEQVLGNHILPQKLPNVPKKIRFLEVVVINGFSGTENQLLVLMYFIANGDMLKSISKKHAEG
ncbi:putative F-box/LRR-repeat protein [Glycine soja]|uniref:Uncharacterized protein n=2 Tax=Glycine subgen. Soja TaxID=1462606 RepID=A0A0R0L2Z3_SOYBN|nr:putative F-box/LRR-repeat protein [Glycine soja]